jgi:actin-like ATPase involved in cell morphogenesis
MDNGITLTGGASLLHGLAERLSCHTGVPTRVAEHPWTCTAIGAAKALGKQSLVANHACAPAVAVTTAAAST